MTNVKNAKFVSLNQVSSKFGEGVILDPILTSNLQGSGSGGKPAPSPWLCIDIGQGCGSSNKIKVFN